MYITILFDPNFVSNFIQIARPHNRKMGLFRQHLLSIIRQQPFLVYRVIHWLDHKAEHVIMEHFQAYKLNATQVGRKVENYINYWYKVSHFDIFQCMMSVDVVKYHINLRIVNI